MLTMLDNITVLLCVIGLFMVGKYWKKMVDYLKKALIYGHTSRISS